MFVTMLAWLVKPAVFGPVMPFALTLAFFIVLFDLLLLVIDLGDHVPFLHAMRVMHPTSPLSVGVVSLIFYTVMLFHCAGHLLGDVRVAGHHRAAARGRCRSGCTLPSVRRAFAHLLPAA